MRTITGGSVAVGVGVVLSGLLAGSAVAGPEGDFGLSIDAGRLVTNSWDHDTSTLGEAERVFAGELALVSGAVFGDEPGYGAPAGTFAGDGQVVFTLARALREWNGSTFVASTARLLIEDDGGAFSVWTPAADGDPASTFFLPVSTAEVHQHYSNYLYAGDQLTPAGTGIYLLKLVASAPGLGLAASEPAYIVFKYGVSEEDHEAAIEYVETVIVPTPGVMALAGFAGLAAARRRR